MSWIGALMARPRLALALLVGLLISGACAAYWAQGRELKTAEAERDAALADIALANQAVQAAKRVAQANAEALHRELIRAQALEQTLAARAETNTRLRQRAEALSMDLQEARDAATIEVQECLGLPLPDDVLRVVPGRAGAAGGGGDGDPRGARDAAGVAAGADAGPLVRRGDVPRRAGADDPAGRGACSVQRGQGRCAGVEP